ncbi:nuclear filament-containing protein 2 [Hibiscus trionum]|uniref:Nuclear filament-containing protein 2 n=1 Tax=Hibiscus trionum TaxID=183268 RepID=A0A9W7GSS5_HIBTR|nr:nuclear filament-containing protein 2 [Hibiscus trionum]
MSTFGYPVLSRADIISLLAESQIAAVTDNDFKNIKPDFVSNLYTRLLIYIDALNEEDQGQFEFSALEQIENPDLLIGSFQVMNLYCRLREVTESLNCPIAFNLRDLVKPDPRRTEHFVSTILNFCLYKDTKMNILNPIVEELAHLDDQREEQETKISQLNAEIAGYREARERELPLVQEVESKVKELRDMIAVFNSNQMSLRTSIRNLKEKNGQMDEKISKAEFDLVQSFQENANLRSKIVQSPDKIQRALEEKKLARDEAKNAERSAMESFQQKTATVEVYSKALKKMSKHFALMQAIHEQVNSAKSVEKECKSMKAKLSDDAVLDKSFEAKLQMLKPLVYSSPVGQLEEHLWQLQKERDLKFEESTKFLNSVKSEVSSTRCELEARQKKVEDVVTEVDSITLKTSMVRESGAAKVQQLISKCEELVKQFQEYSSSIGLQFPVDESGTMQLDSIAITSL